MRTLKKALATVVAMALAISLSSCEFMKEKHPVFSDTQSICELATVEVYYHNVAKYEKGADVWPIPNIFDIGRKRMWFEYVASVRFGIDASKVQISQPDENNVVTVTIPQAEVLSKNGTIYQDTMTTPITDNGPLTTLTPQEKTDCLNAAQENMMKAASSDESLLNQARSRAKVLLEQYVKNVGEAIGEDYTVVFVDAE